MHDSQLERRCMSVKQLQRATDELQALAALPSVTDFEELARDNRSQAEHGLAGQSINSVHNGHHTAPFFQLITPTPPRPPMNQNRAIKRNSLSGIPISERRLSRRMSTRSSGQSANEDAHEGSEGHEKAPFEQENMAITGKALSLPRQSARLKERSSNERMTAQTRISSAQERRQMEMANLPARKVANERALVEAQADMSPDPAAGSSESRPSSRQSVRAVSPSLSLKGTSGVIAGLQAEIDGLRSSNNLFKERLKAEQVESAKLNVEAQTLRTKVKRLEDERERKVAYETRRERIIDELMAKLTRIETAKAEGDAKVQDMEEERKALARKCEKLEREAVERQERLKVLEANLVRQAQLTKGFKEENANLANAQQQALRECQEALLELERSRTELQSAREACEALSEVQTHLNEANLALQSKDAALECKNSQYQALLDAQNGLRTQIQADTEALRKLVHEERDAFQNASKSIHTQVLAWQESASDLCQAQQEERHALKNEMAELRGALNSLPDVDISALEEALSELKTFVSQHDQSSVKQIS